MVKHKSWVASVHRVRGELSSRHGKLRLDKNERVMPFPAEFMARLAEDLSSELIEAYPETEVLYQLLAQQLGVDTESLMLTAGSDGAIRHCFDLFVSPGDEVVVLEPTFAMVDIYCQLAGAKRRSIGYGPDLQLDVDGLISAIGEATSLIVIANPNSPTGTVISSEDIERILARAECYSVAVLIDEAYFGFCGQTALPLVSRFHNLVVSRTFSKSAGLAGLRVGYLVAQPELAQLLYRFRPMYEVNALGVAAAMRILHDPKLIADNLSATEAGRRFFHAQLQKRGIGMIDTHTNFVHVRLGSLKDAINRQFAADDILVRGGLPLPGFEDCLRISLGPVPAMQRVLDSIDAVMTHNSAPPL